MPSPEHKLSIRRRQLIARCEVERIELIQHSHEMQGLMAGIDSTLHALRSVKQHPGIVFGALAAVLVIVRPRRLGALLRSVMSASRTWQAVAPVLHGLRRHT